MKILRPLFFIMIQLVVCLLVVEVTCSVFLNLSSNPLYRSRKILQYDEKLGWMQKPDLDTTFEKQKVYTSAQGFRLNSTVAAPLNETKFLTLGPSSAFGWGVNNEETYTSLAAKNLNLSSLNASGIGHSIIQGTIMWELLKDKIQPEYVLIAYGVNDLDKFRFFDSEPLNDSEFFKMKPQANVFDQHKLPTNTITTLSLVQRQLTHTYQCSQLINPVQRVSFEIYEEKLVTLIKELKAKHIKTVLINTPFYLKQKNIEFSKDLINKAYKESSDAAMAGDCKLAHEKLKFAKSLEPDNIAYEVSNLNNLIAKISREQSVAVVDAFKLLVDSNPAVNFFDPVHPSVAGHKKIAQNILEQIRK